MFFLLLLSVISLINCHDMTQERNLASGVYDYS